MLVNSYGFIFIYTCIHVDTLSAHTQKSELQYKYWYKFHFFFQKTINIVKHIMALHGLPFLLRVQYFYSLYNKSYLFTVLNFCFMNDNLYALFNFCILETAIWYYCQCSCFIKYIYIIHIDHTLFFLFLTWECMLTMICYRKQNSAI